MKKLLTIVLVVVALSSCSGQNKIKTAQQLGQQHAIEILDNEITGRQLMMRLF